MENSYKQVGDKIEIIEVKEEVTTITPDELQGKIDEAQGRLDTLATQHQEAFDRLTAELQVLLDHQEKASEVIKDIETAKLEAIQVEKIEEPVNLIKIT